MDQGTKRKRDSTIPTLVYSAPGYNRFAKLFTETSLDEIKEIVRKRLGLSSISDFTLFYDTDISLENDDDFDAFEVHSHSSASAVNVIVKILSPSHAPPAGPSVVSQSSGPVPLDVDMGGAKPPQKKRKVAADAPAKPISSAPKDKQKTSVGAKVAGEGPTKPTAPERSRRKSNAVPIEVESISTAHAAPGVASKEIERPGEEPPKKKRKKEAEKTSTASPVDTSSAKQAPDTATQERTKRKSKKAVEKGPSDQPNLPASSTVPSTANEIPEIRKVKSKKNPEPGLEPAPPKPTTSKKSTKPSKKDKQQTEDVPNADGSAQNPVKSVKFAEQLANTIENGLAQSEPVTASHQKSRDPPPAEKDSGKVTKPKGKKKIVEQDVGSSEPPDPESLNEFWKGLRPTASIPTTEPQLVTDNRGEQQATKGTKKPVSDSKSHKQTATKDPATFCPICETSPLHISYRCPIVLAGSGSIRQRIAELQQDEKADHLKLIQELRGLAEKSVKTNQIKKPQNVNAHSPHLRADAQHGGVSVSDPSLDIPGHKVATASGPSPDADDSDSSSDSESAPLARKKVPPRPVDPDMDAELEAIIRGPMPSRLTVDDILFEEEEGDAADSVVLENDEDDVEFRRRSRQLDIAASSGEEDDEDEEPLLDCEGAAPKSSAAISISTRRDSRHPSTRSPTEPLMAIDARHSVDFDHAGDMAVDDAMASDNVMFGLEAGHGDSTAQNADGFIDSPHHSAGSTPTPLTPQMTSKLDLKTRSTSARLRTPAAVEELTESLSDRSDIPRRGEDDPIQPAEDFPPTPIQPNRIVTQPGTPTTPRMVQRMKDRNGKIAVKLSQLDLPFSLSSQIQTQPAESAQDGSLTADKPVEPTVAPKTTTRSSTRLAAAASMPLIPPEQPAKRRRAPNKTPEQRVQEEAAKLAAKEEKERVRKEKAQAKAAEKNKKKVADKSLPNNAAQATPPPGDLPSLEDSVELTKVVPPSSRTPMSQDEWTVLKPPTSPTSEYRDQESMRDELHSSSPSDGRDGHEAPLFLPAESQVPFPYSQWNSIPEFYPGSPKDSEDEEEEVAAAMKSPQRPSNASIGSYRRLTDIASQPALFSATPASRATRFPSATFPSAKDKRDELYGKLPQEDDDSNDSDSSAGDAPSHIPKSRRAGMITRQR